MVEERSPDDTVDPLCAKALRELAQGQHRNGQIPYRPVADREGFDPPLLNLGVLATGKSALHRPELRDAKLPGEFRVERHLRAAGVDEKSDLVAPVHAHADQWQRVCPQEFQTRTLPIAAHLVRRLALEALQLRNIQRRIL